MKRLLPFLIFLVLTVSLAMALLDHPRREGASTLGSAMEAPLPELAVFTRDHTAATIKMDGKVTWVNFFASWCAPCVEDHQQLMALMRTYPNMVLHGIAWNDTVSRVDEWLMQHRNPFTQVWFDSKGKAAMSLGVRGMPENFLVDRHGRIRYHITGPLTPEVRTRIIEPLIAELMEEP